MVGTTGTSFAQKYGINGNTALFKKKYTISNGNTSFYNDISKYRELENTYSLSIMSKLSANYDKLKAVEGKNDEYANAMKEITGRAGVNVGIKDIEKAREPLYTSDPSGERGGMGFSIMESFTNKMKVTSKENQGTTVTLMKRLKW